MTDYTVKNVSLFYGRNVTCTLQNVPNVNGLNINTNFVNVFTERYFRLVIKIFYQIVISSPELIRQFTLK